MCVNIILLKPFRYQHIGIQTLNILTSCKSLLGFTEVYLISLEDLCSACLILVLARGVWHMETPAPASSSQPANLTFCDGMSVVIWSTSTSSISPIFRRLTTTVPAVHTPSDDLKQDMKREREKKIHSLLASSFKLLNKSLIC